MRDYLGTDEEREKGNQFSRNKLALIFNDMSSCREQFGEDSDGILVKKDREIFVQKGDGTQRYHVHTRDEIYSGRVYICRAQEHDHVHNALPESNVLRTRKNEHCS